MFPNIRTAQLGAKLKSLTLKYNFNNKSNNNNNNNNNNTFFNNINSGNFHPKFYSMKQNCPLTNLKI